MELRPTCENCDKALPNGSSDAMICTFDCTFCKNCVDNVLYNVCPNCGGGFETRPTRPKHHLLKHPFISHKVFKPVKITDHKTLLSKFKDIDPLDR